MPMLKVRIRNALRAMPPKVQCLIMAWRSRHSLQKGPGSYVHSSVQILGRAHVSIGANTVIGQDCWLNVNHRTDGRLAIVIGNQCFIGRRNFFSSGASIQLSDFVLTANDCHFLGSTHLVDDPMKPVICTGTSNLDSIIVGTNTFIGAGARILGSVKIGHGCVIGAGSTVTRDVPPFSQAHGHPARVHKRYSFGQRKWIAAALFTAEDEAALPTESAYVQHLSAVGRIPMPHIAAGADLGSF
ncbi:acyltransferase [Azohydromonas australica]|uniref:acyltransferase n=1 Tax=Azohydromonas australica TaxID=364039 RepID=UPI0009FBACFB|nr:acyltransferase [Azohydromonas australica]